MKTTSLDEFYQQMTALASVELSTLLPSDIQKEVGHFNVFNLDDLLKNNREKPVMPYDRRAYYKISLIRGRNRAEYADKVIEMEHNTLLFATPNVPYHWIPQDLNQSGQFCIFTGDFLIQTKSGVVLDELPIFRAGGYPVFEASDEEFTQMKAVFDKMQKEITSNYAYKYDLLRNYVLELIHYGQKLQPATALHPIHTASARVTSLFIELLERQFPIGTPQQQLRLRTAKDYADRLAIHVNHLNKVLKDSTGRTTTDLISSRVTQEAKVLLRQTNWNVSEIAWCLGFDELANFSNFFRKQTSLSPVTFRSLPA
ncbi:MAG TPA: helix-turn-helix transcriptional regulator [Spirosoma sp.]|nr:helix-turn-helix transcriptional regulator [Spirosoma sp.]